MNTKHALAVESISFQGNALFEGITAAVTTLRATLKTNQNLEAMGGIKCPLAKVIKSITGLSVYVEISDSPYESFTMYSPILRDGHIFDAVHGEHSLASSKGKRIFQELSGSVVERGSVDLRKNRVSGFFADLLFVLLVSTNDLRSTTLKDQEVAALILHEIGHAFASCEYVSRTISTNQVLADIADGYMGGEEKLNVVLLRVAKEQDLTPHQQEMLNKAKKPEDYVVCIYAIADEKCRSELGGFSVYDKVSFEQLADQYAARCGAGRYLITGMDWLYRRDGDVIGRTVTSSITRALFHHMATFAVVSIPLAFTLPMLGVALAALVTTCELSLGAYLSVAKLEFFPYDDLHARVERIYQQMVQQLKSQKLPATTLKALLAEIDEVQETLKPLRENAEEAKTHQLGHYVALLFNSVYRKRINSEQLQKQLEALASNDLFVAAAKLKTL